MHSKLQYYYSRYFKVLILCVGTFWHSSCQPMHKSTPVEEQFHFIYMLNLSNLCKIHTCCTQKSRLILHLRAKQAGNSTLLVPGILLFLFLHLCILFADLPRYGSLNFAPDFLFLTHLGSLCIFQFLYTKTFILRL